MSGGVKKRLIAAMILTLIVAAKAGANVPAALEIASMTPPAPYTEREVDMLSRMVYGEALGCAGDEQALCVWTAINRLDDGRFGETISEVLTAPGQFTGYSEKHPVTDGIRAVVRECLTEWALGEPAPLLAPYATERPYLYFDGGHMDEHDRPHNFFRQDNRRR
jgi:hypothetical protein